MSQTNNIKLMSIVEGTSVDGVGLRTSIYLAGCSHHCKGCHNPESWNIENGKDYTIDEVFKVIEYNRYPVTFTGGDPFYQLEGSVSLAKKIKDELGYDIWCYTGYLYEDIIRDEKLSKLLDYVDVLVDGRFELDKRDTSLLFKGSSNQRIIDVKKSREEKKVALFGNFSV